MPRPKQYVSPEDAFDNVMATHGNGAGIAAVSVDDGRPIKPGARKVLLQVSLPLGTLERLDAMVLAQNRRRSAIVAVLIEEAYARATALEESLPTKVTKAARKGEIRG